MNRSTSPSFESIFPELPAHHLIVERRETALASVAACHETARQLPEKPYEGCMFARILENERERGVLMIRFPPGLGLSELPIHHHPTSDRKILILEGKGSFHFVEPKSGRIESVPVTRGDYVAFPKGFLHTFTTSDHEMVVMAAHEPFQDLDDPDILDYDAEGNAKTREQVPSSRELPIKMRVE